MGPGKKHPTGYLTKTGRMKVLEKFDETRALCGDGKISSANHYSMMVEKKKQIQVQNPTRPLSIIDQQKCAHNVFKAVIKAAINVKTRQPSTYFLNAELIHFGHPLGTSAKREKTNPSRSSLGPFFTVCKRWGGGGKRKLNTLYYRQR